MNNGTTETPTTARNPYTMTTTDELDTLKRELMKAEVRFAKARATLVSAEIDIKVLSARLKAATKKGGQISRSFHVLGIWRKRRIMRDLRVKDVKPSSWQISAPRTKDIYIKISRRRIF